MRYSIGLLCLTLLLVHDAPVGLAADTLESGAENPESIAQSVVSDSLGLLSLNIAHGRDTALNQMFVAAAQHRSNLSDIVTLVDTTGAHVVGLQEADAPSLWSGRFDHVSYLATRSNFGAYIHGYHATSWLYGYGAALLSSVRLDGASSHRFEPSWPTTTKGYVRADIRWRLPDEGARAATVTVVSVHLDFSRESVRRSQTAEIVQAFIGLKGPLIVLGDFNADWQVPDSPVRTLARELSLQAYRPEYAGLGSYKEAERLDWILVSQELEFLEYTVLPDIVSDHKAVFARVGWKSEE